MGIQELTKNTVMEDLGNGLVLRQARPEDAEALAAFNAAVHGEPDVPGDAQRVAVWTRDLLERPHPTFKASDFAIVEEAASGKIVSALGLISQTWSYEGIDFGVGRPELVGTHSDYRRRGLVRAQFDIIHQWSAERGEMVQAITGIPYFYRQFGYEMAMNLGGSRRGYLPDVPKLKDGESEPYRVRPAERADLVFIAELYRTAAKRYAVHCVRDETMWEYERAGKSNENVNRFELCLVETAAGEPVGYLAHPHFNWYKGVALTAIAYEINTGHSWAAVTPSVLRYLETTGREYATQVDGVEFGGFGFLLGEMHPVYQVIPDRLPKHARPYAWYLRVPDLAGFLRHIAPVLEGRLAASPVADYSGSLKLTFYRLGLKIDFESGCLAKVDAWQPEPHLHSGDAGFPELTFLQLLFGYRSLDELKYAFADCWWANDEVAALLKSLFPKKPSDVWPVA